LFTNGGFQRQQGCGHPRLKRVLDFVENHGWVQSFKKRTRVIAYAALHVGIFEKHLLSIGEELTQQRRFSNAAWSRHDHG
jgi:hypothetical protein